MRFSTALRQPVRRHLELLEKADIIVGIPCFNNETTISHVIRKVEEGLHLNYPDRRCVVFIADGGSVDDTREESESIAASPWIERIITIYRGVPGKGTALRAIFEAAVLLDAKVCVLFDSDLRSITADWVKSMVDAILNDSVDFVAPYYTRYKYDGTITNNIVYNLTRSLYGYRVRQPIGGDFGIALPLIKKLISQDVWESDVARFGVDVWLTTMAMINNCSIAQANLGVKIHDIKDPAEALGPMFRQVVATLLHLMEENETIWKKVKGSKPVPIIGPALKIEPKPFEINVGKLVADFKIGCKNWCEIWKKIIAQENWIQIQDLVNKEEHEFRMDTEVWAKILYDLAAAFHHWKGNREILVSLMTPLYFARVASFVNQTREMSNEQAEAVVEEQAEIFEKTKEYLIKKWDEPSHMYDM